MQFTVQPRCPEAGWYPRSLWHAVAAQSWGLGEVLGASGSHLSVIPGPGHGTTLGVPGPHCQPVLEHPWLEFRAWRPAALGPGTWAGRRSLWRVLTAGVRQWSLVTYGWHVAHHVGLACCLRPVGVLVWLHSWPQLLLPSGWHGLRARATPGPGVPVQVAGAPCAAEPDPPVPRLLRGLTPATLPRCSFTPTHTTYVHTLPYP